MTKLEENIFQKSVKNIIRSYNLYTNSVIKLRTFFLIILRQKLINKVYAKIAGKIYGNMSAHDQFDQMSFFHI